jgi:CheY-like chemotaxis protein
MPSTPLPWHPPCTSHVQGCGLREARSWKVRPDMRVLVIGDDEVIHKTVVGLTRISGVRVYAAHDQWEGLELLGDIRPDLILCDLEPRCDGLRFVKSLRQMPAHRRTLTAAFAALRRGEPRRWLRRVSREADYTRDARAALGACAEAAIRPGYLTSQRSPQAGGAQSNLAR